MSSNPPARPHVAWSGPCPLDAVRRYHTVPQFRPRPRTVSEQLKCVGRWMSASEMVEAHRSQNEIPNLKCFICCGLFFEILRFCTIKKLLFLWDSVTATLSICQVCGQPSLPCHVHRRVFRSPGHRRRHLLPLRPTSVPCPRGRCASPFAT